MRLLLMAAKIKLHRRNLRLHEVDSKENLFVILHHLIGPNVMHALQLASAMTWSTR
jgi:hypothetical protein